MKKIIVILIAVSFMFAGCLDFTQEDLREAPCVCDIFGQENTSCKCPPGDCPCTMHPDDNCGCVNNILKGCGCSGGADPNPNCSCPDGGCDCSTSTGPGCGCVAGPPGTCNCDKSNLHCNCVDDCACGSGCKDTCKPPIVTWPCGRGEDCTCEVCTCGPGSGACPPPVIPTPEPGVYGLNSSRNTLIDTGVAIREGNDGNGNVWVWGFRGTGQQGNGVSAVSNSAPPTMVRSLRDINIVQVTGSAYTIMARDDQGRLWGWGDNPYGVAGSSNRVVNTPTRVGSLTGVVDVRSGEYFYIALRMNGSNGEVYTWGQNTFGQLGNNGGATAHRNSPQRVSFPSNENPIMIGSSYEGAFAITANTSTGNRTVWAWGRNVSNSLGLGSNANYRTPQRVTMLDVYANSINYIDGGYRFGNAVMEDGSVIGWGRQSRLGIGVTDNDDLPPRNSLGVRVVPVPGKVTQLHSRFLGTVALTEAGIMYTWGHAGVNETLYGVYGGGFTVRGSGIADIGGGKEHVYYRTTGGQVFGAGYGAANKFINGSAANIHMPGIPLDLPN